MRLIANSFGRWKNPYVIFRGPCLILRRSTAARSAALRALAVLPRKAGCRGFVSPQDAGGLADIAAAAVHREGRAAREPGRASAARRARGHRHLEAARIYSTSGTSGVPLYIPLTGATSSSGARSVGAPIRERPEGRRARRDHVRRRPLRRRRLARRVRGDRRGAHSRSAWETPTPPRRHRAAAAAKRSPARRPMRCMSPRWPQRKNRRLKTAIQRIIVGGEPGGGEDGMRKKLETCGREDLRDHGHRRHRGLALGRVPGAGRHAFLGRRARPRRADRSGYGAAAGNSPTAQRANWSTRTSSARPRRCCAFAAGTTSALDRAMRLRPTAPRVRCIGRTDDMLIVRGVNVFPSAVREIVARSTGGHGRDLDPAARRRRAAGPAACRYRRGRGRSPASHRQGNPQHAHASRLKCIWWRQEALPRSDYKSKLVDYSEAK